MYYNRRQSIEWIKCINADLHVNLSDEQQIALSKAKIKLIEVYTIKERMMNVNSIDFKEAEFCLFRDFPFNQLVVFNLEPIKKQNLKSDCVFLWLIQFHHRIANLTGSWDIYINGDPGNLYWCEFEKKIELCLNSNYFIKEHSVMPKSVDFYSIDFMMLLEFILILYMLLVSLLGVVLNTITVWALYKGRSVFNENQYTFMAIHSFANILIYFTTILSLANECQFPFGFYCSSTSQLIFVQ